MKWYIIISMHLDEIIIVPLILIIALKLVPSVGIPIIGSPTITVTPTPSATGTLPTTGPGTPTVTPTPTSGSIPTLTPTTTPTPINCPVNSTRTYRTCQAYPDTNGNHPTPPAAQHYDINAINMRGYNLTSGLKDFINRTPQADDDPNAPQLYYLLNKTPTFTNLYKIGRAPWDPPTLPYEVHLVGLAANVNDPVMVPDVNGGFSCAEVLVLYADQNNITLKYTPDDTVVGGYTVHISGICVDPALLNKYQSNSVIRTQLPALNGKDILGTARGNEVKVSIRDGNGTFMDPRSYKDWWQRPRPPL